MRAWTPLASLAMLLTASLVTALAAAAQAPRGPLCHHETPPPVEAPAARCTEAASHVPAAHRLGPDLRAAIDPETGRLVLPARPAPDVPRGTFGISRDPRGEPRQRRLPGGGWKLGLQGRRLHPLIATVGGDGRVSTRHGKPATELPEVEGPEAEDRLEEAPRKGTPPGVER